MREILFRGKRVNNGEWIYGDLQHNGKNIPKWVEGEEIIPETIGQFTGLTNKNGKKIFEGDIVRTYEPYPIDISIKGVVEFGEYSTAYQRSNVGYYVNWLLNKNLAIYCTINDIEVIGNIHDNKELLGE